MKKFLLLGLIGLGVLLRFTASDIKRYVQMRKM
jgi:hypothetical protein